MHDAVAAATSENAATEHRSVSTGVGVVVAVVLQDTSIPLKIRVDTASFADVNG